MWEHDNLNGYKVPCRVHHQPAVFEARFVMDLDRQAFDFIMIIGGVEAHLRISMVPRLAKKRSEEIGRCRRANHLDK